MSENRIRKYVRVRETWTIIAHDYEYPEIRGSEHLTIGSGRFHWEENHCSQNELRKLCESILARLDKDDAESVCNACAYHKAELLGVYDTLEEAEKDGSGLKIEAEDYEPPP